MIRDIHGAVEVFEPLISTEWKTRNRINWMHLRRPELPDNIKSVLEKGLAAVGATKDLEKLTKTLRDPHDLVLDRPNHVFGVLFGVNPNNPRQQGLFSGRGLPGNAARMTREEFTRWQPDAHGMTYVTWPELRDIYKSVCRTGLVDSPTLPEGKAGAFERLCGMMGGIAHAKYGDSGVRLVVWFDN